MSKKKISPNRRITLISGIQETLDDSSDEKLDEWAINFLTNTQETLLAGKDLTKKWYNKLLDFVEV